MTKTTMFAGPFGEIAVHETEGVGRPIVLIHGNSCSARAFSRQLDGPLRRFAPSRRDRPDGTWPFG